MNRHHTRMHSYLSVRSYRREHSSACQHPSIALSVLEHSRLPCDLDGISGRVECPVVD